MDGEVVVEQADGHGLKRLHLQLDHVRIQVGVAQHVLADDFTLIPRTPVGKAVEESVVVLVETRVPVGEGRLPGHLLELVGGGDVPAVARVEAVIPVLMDILGVEAQRSECLRAVGRGKGFDPAADVEDVHAVPGIDVRIQGVEAATEAGIVVESVVDGGPAQFGGVVGDGVVLQVDQVHVQSAGLHADDARILGRPAPADPVGAAVAAGTGVAVEQEAVAHLVLLAAEGDVEEILAERAEQIARTPAGVGVLDAQVTDIAETGVGGGRVQAAAGVGLHGVHPAVDLLGVGQEVTAFETRTDERLPPGIGILAEGLPGVAKPGVALVEQTDLDLEGGLGVTVVAAGVELQRIGLLGVGRMDSAGEEGRRHQQGGGSRVSAGCAQVLHGNRLLFWGLRVKSSPSLNEFLKKKHQFNAPVLRKNNRQNSRLSVALGNVENLMGALRGWQRVGRGLSGLSGRGAATLPDG